jgi:hypothetical protein
MRLVREAWAPIVYGKQHFQVLDAYDVIYNAWLGMRATPHKAGR